MSLYFMYNHSSVDNVMKIGYMSTTNIKHIMGRYSTGCGSNIMVFMFLNAEPRLMESNFKKYFEKQHLELEFYDSAHLVHYIRWATEYSNSLPIVGDGKFKLYGEFENKPISTQTVWDEDKAQVSHSIGIQTIENPEKIHLFNDPETETAKFNLLDDDNVVCVACKRTVIKTNYKRHLPVCKGVPKNTCRYCLFKFSTQPAHSRHQNRCKLNPVNVLKTPQINTDIPITRINTPFRPMENTDTPVTQINHIVNNYYSGRDNNYERERDS